MSACQLHSALACSAWAMDASPSYAIGTMPFFPLPEDFAHVPFADVLWQVRMALLAAGVPLSLIDGPPLPDEGSLPP
jgi:hypothetical protein